MTNVPERLALVCIAGFTACLCAACAGTGTIEPSPALAPQAAMDVIAIGKSTKADVSSALGKAIVIPFDSGYEVWVYRWAGGERTTRAATELVVLFEPTGLASKVRVRPGYPTRN
jgi:hypothetical protein